MFGKGAVVAFLIFERAVVENRLILRKTTDVFELAGYNLLYRAWETRGKPFDVGWGVTRDELIQLHCSPQPTRNDVSLIIDVAPKSSRKVELVELVEVHAYTTGNNGVADWTPLMLRLRDVFDGEYEHAMSPEERDGILRAIPCNGEGRESIEFLYLAKRWNWGMTGRTNAVFLQDGARNYFRQFF
jgi:hypothetical protein